MLPDNIVTLEARMDDFEEIQDIMNEITSGSPVDAGWIAEVEAQEQFEQLDWDAIEPIPF